VIEARKKNTIPTKRGGEEGSQAEDAERDVG